MGRGRRTGESRGQHLIDVHQFGCACPPPATKRRCCQTGIGWLRSASRERDHLVCLANLGRCRWTSLTFDEPSHPMLKFGLDVDAPCRELDKHRIVDADDVSLAVRVDLAERYAERRL